MRNTSIERQQKIESFQEEINTLKDTLDILSERMAKSHLPSEHISRHTETLRNMNQLITSLMAVFY